MVQQAGNESRYLFLLGELFGRKGGIEMFNRSLLRSVQDMEDVRCVALILNDQSIPSGCRWSNRMRFIACSTASWRFLSKLRFLLKAIEESLRLRPQAVVCGHVNFLPVCLLLKKVLGIRYVLLAYGIEVWEESSGLNQWGFRQAEKVLSISRYTREKILARPFLPPQKVELLPCMVDTARFVPAPRSSALVKRYGLAGEHVLLTVSRLSRQDNYKGHEIVLRALPKILRARQNVKYMIAGAGDYSEHLRSCAQELGIERKVIFTGSIPDHQLPDYYNLCDVFVMPSKGEGFGIVFLEALACGKPVIAGNRDGSRDALLDGRLGLLVNPDDPEEVADAVLSLLNGQAGGHFQDPTFLRNEVIESFGFERFRHRVQELFQQLG